MKRHLILRVPLGYSPGSAAAVIRDRAGVDCTSAARQVRGTRDTDFV